MDLGGGAEVKIKLFLEYGHVAYKINADDAGSNMVANILPTDTPSDPGVASSIPVWSHTFVEIDHEMISTVIFLLPLINSRRVVCQLEAKVCARITG